MALIAKLRYLVAIWNFRCYVDGRGVDVIRAWYEISDKKVQGKFDSRIQTLAGKPRNEWIDPLFHQLNGKYTDIGEMKFEVKRVAFRPLGFHHQGNFVLLFPAKEVNGRFEPKTAPDTALTRRAEVLENMERTRGLDWIPIL
jgi:hypothetical protein